MMYQRQRVMLSLLSKMPEEKASKIQFVKWLFLLKEEENIDRYVKFYSFFPYKYGPFSLVAYRDIDELERFGWIKSDSKFLRYIVPKRGYSESKLSLSVMYSIEKIMGNYGMLPQQSLVNYVYEKYPWYASRSSIRQSDSPKYPPKARPAVYSLGYEGLSIDAFLDAVLKAGIQVVIDSRHNPISRKYGFSKNTLAEKCLDVGITYHQFSAVGIPSKIRNQIQDRQTLWDFYTEEILAKNSEALKSIANICKNAPSVLICFERKPEDCHRHIIAREISVRTGLPIIHYAKGGWKENGGEDRSSHNCQDLPYAVKQV